MKTLGLIFLTLLMSKSCSNQAQKDLKDSVVQYAADTRGYHLKIIIVDQKATITQGRGLKNEAQVIAISDADWNELVAQFQKVNLEELPNLKDPTQYRFYDGAPIANLKIRYQDKNYETTDFDHGYPPAAIEKLVNKIASLAPKLAE